MNKLTSALRVQAAVVRFSAIIGIGHASWQRGAPIAAATVLAGTRRHLTLSRPLSSTGASAVVPPNTWVRRLGAVSGAAAVGAGAIGAHALPAQLREAGKTEEEVASYKTVFETAAKVSGDSICAVFAHPASMFYLLLRQALLFLLSTHLARNLICEAANGCHAVPPLALRSARLSSGLPLPTRGGRTAWRWHGDLLRLCLFSGSCWLKGRASCKSGADRGCDADIWLARTGNIARCASAILSIIHFISLIQ